MKRKIIVLTLLLIALSISLYAQKKKDLEKDLAACTAAKDSIQKTLAGLTTKYDSVSKACLSYDKMKQTIKEKVTKTNFQNENIGKIIDSLQINRDSALVRAKAKLPVVRDSVKSLNRLCDSLRKEVGHLTYMINKYIGKGTIPATAKDFSGSWTFNTRWFELADDSIQSGIILKPTPIDVNLVSKAIVLDFETVQVIFAKGDTIKCFYKVNSFSKDKPYTIDLTRESKVNIRLNVNPFDNELYVSYRRGKGYFYGFLRKD